MEDGISNVTLDLVSTATEKVFNQWGVKEVAAGYWDKPQWVQDLELEANSAEIDIDLVRLAYRLAEDGV